jgi:phosphate uptake regulator
MIDSENAVTITAGADYTSNPVMTCLKKMEDQASYMYSEAMKILTRKMDPKKQEYFRTLDETVDGLYLYAVRAIKSCSDDERLMQLMHLDSHRETLAVRLVARYLERIADHSGDLGDDLSKFVSSGEKIPDSIKKQIELLGESAQKSLENATKAFFDKNYYEADKEIDRIDNAFVEYQSETKGIKKAETDLNEEIQNDKAVKAPVGCELASIVRSILRVARNSKGIAHMALNAYFHRAQHDT